MHVVIAGGGIAGVECALTIALGHEDARVTLVHEWPSLRLLPNLVYVPFGVSPHRLDVPIVESLAPHGIECVEGRVEHVDVAARTVTVDGAEIAYDKLVLATGVEPERASARTLRSLDDALVLRDELEHLQRVGHGTVTVVQLPENTWPAPGYEFAALLGTWREALDLHEVELMLVTSSETPLGAFGLDAAEAIVGRLDELGVTVLSGVPAGRVEELGEGLTIDMVPLQARRINGAPHVAPDGFWHTGPDGSIARDVYVVGDAADLPYKGAFATSWQARRVLLALGGDLRLLGAFVDGVPVDECEYQLDLGNATLAVRMPCHEHFVGSWAELLAGKEAEIRSQTPDKLRGTLVRQHLLGDHQFTAAGAPFQHLLHHH